MALACLVGLPAEPVSWSRRRLPWAARLRAWFLVLAGDADPDVRWPALCSWAGPSCPGRRTRAWLVWAGPRPWSGRSAACACVGAEHVAIAGPHGQDQDRRHGHEGGDGPRARAACGWSGVCSHSARPCRLRRSRSADHLATSAVTVADRSPRGPARRAARKRRYRRRTGSKKVREVIVGVQLHEVPVPAGGDQPNPVF